MTTRTTSQRSTNAWTFSLPASQIPPSSLSSTLEIIPLRLFRIQSPRSTASSAIKSSMTLRTTSKVFSFSLLSPFSIYRATGVKVPRGGKKLGGVGAPESSS